MIDFIIITNLHLTTHLLIIIKTAIATIVTSNNFHIPFFHLL